MNTSKVYRPRKANGCSWRNRSRFVCGSGKGSSLKSSAPDSSERSQVHGRSRGSGSIRLRESDFHRIQLWRRKGFHTRSRSGWRETISGSGSKSLNMAEVLFESETEGLEGTQPLSMGSTSES